MTSKLEEIARAIAEQHSGFPELWRDHEAEARAAVEAMKNPRIEILNAGAGFVGLQTGWNRTIDAILNEKPA